MARLKYLLTRAQYKKIKKMDHGQMSDWAESLYKIAYENGKKSAEGLNDTELRDILLSVKGIGEAKATAILNAVKLAIEKAAEEKLAEQEG